MSVSSFPYGANTGPSSPTQPGGTVTLSGQSVFGTDTQIVGIRFNSDGTVDQRVGGTYTQIDTGTDWIIPNGDAPDLFEVMTDNWMDLGGAGNGFNSAAASSGTWVALTSNREWNVLADGPDGSSSARMTFDAHIRWNGGSTIDSGAYDIESNGV